jgi:formylglycine-generating enzyme required for sulfatase activity
LGGSLPTEAQWEFALRRKGSGAFQAPTAGTAVANQSASLYNEAYAYNGYTTGAISGTGVPDYVWYGGNSNDESTRTDYGVNISHNHKVGEKEPNGLGLYDMNGNVWEWCADFCPGREDYLLADYVGNDGSDGNGIVVNPINNTVASYSSPSLRFIRGGNWGGVAGNLRAGIRINIYAHDRYSDVGFRPAFLFPFAP